MVKTLFQATAKEEDYIYVPDHEKTKLQDQLKGLQKKK